MEESPTSREKTESTDDLREKREVARKEGGNDSVEVGTEERRNPNKKRALATEPVKETLNKKSGEETSMPLLRGRAVRGLSKTPKKKGLGRQLLFH